ncbi:MAG TPA: GNAT family N-acetyltransferase [Terriglobia bacterium]|nr:GNAT family N-acetyltransferase [Terriglobia bacterium]
MSIRIRRACPPDIPALGQVIEASVRGLQAHDYSPRQIELALKTLYGVDTQLIADGTYFAAEAASEGTQVQIVGCGGWSRRRTLFGGDQWCTRQDDLLDPRRDPAKIRAFFVRPEWARRRISTMILDVCEAAARAAGFKRLEMGATLSGVPFYRAKGYTAFESVNAPLAEGESLPIVRMVKEI